MFAPRQFSSNFLFQCWDQAESRAWQLSLESAEDTAFIVAKAIQVPFLFMRSIIRSLKKFALQDGVIDATIDHGTKTMVSKANLDVYSTAEPQVIPDLFCDIVIISGF